MLCGMCTRGFVVDIGVIGSLYTNSTRLTNRRAECLSGRADLAQRKRKEKKRCGGVPTHIWGFFAERSPPGTDGSRSLAQRALVAFNIIGPIPACCKGQGLA